MRTAIIFFLFVLAGVKLFAQTSDTIGMMHYFDPAQGMLLKWLPRSKDVFMAGMQNGYELYRAEANGSGVAERLGTFQKLNSSTISRWKMDKFMAEWGKDSSISVAGMLIEIADGYKPANEADNMLDARKETEKRETEYFLAAFSAVVNNTAAEALGLYFVDKTADPTKKYVYRIEIPGHEELISHSIVFPVRESQNGKIMGIMAKQDRDAFVISWLNDKYSDFPYFNIYRSEQKNKNFKKLNKRPYLGGGGDVALDRSRVRYVDSFPQFDKTYYYKIVGVNAFGIESEPSDIIGATSKYMLKNAPWVLKPESPDNMAVDLDWEIYPEDEPYIAGFSVKRAHGPDGPFHKVNEKMLSSKTMHFVDNTPKTAENYYYVCAYGKNGDSLCSILMSIFLIDSISPEKPEIISGACDTNGYVTLSWKPNAEEDLLGYRVFRTYLEGYEPVRMTADYIADTVFHDTLSLGEPYNSIFYRIYAVDYHVNPSFPSDYFEVAIPDINPPTNGYLESHKTSSEGITIAWRNSNAYDLEAMHLMRKSKYDLDFQSIARFSGDSLAIVSYTDTATKSNQYYEYAVEAEDQAGLRSGLSQSVRVKQPSKKAFIAVTDLRFVASRENRVVKLAWIYPEFAEGFRIYRAHDGKPLTTLTFVPGNTREFYDKRVSPGKTYQYKVVAQLPGGGRSGFSSTITVDY